jgi:hypothetical protein
VGRNDIGVIFASKCGDVPGDDGSAKLSERETAIGLSSCCLMPGSCFWTLLTNCALVQSFIDAELFFNCLLGLLVPMLGAVASAFAQCCCNRFGLETCRSK